MHCVCRGFGHGLKCVICMLILVFCMQLLEVNRDVHKWCNVAELSENLDQM